MSLKQSFSLFQRVSKKVGQTIFHVSKWFKCLKLKKKLYLTVEIYKLTLKHIIKNSLKLFI